MIGCYEQMNPGILHTENSGDGDNTGTIMWTLNGIGASLLLALEFGVRQIEPDQSLFLEILPKVLWAMLFDN